MINMIVAFVVGVFLGALGMFFFLSDGYKKLGGK